MSMGKSGISSMKDRIIGYIKGWYDALLIALKIRKANDTVDSGSFDHTA